MVAFTKHTVCIENRGGQLLNVQQSRFPNWFNVLSIVIAASFIYSLENVYVGFLSPRYTYLGFAYREPPLWAYISAWTLALLPSALLPQTNRSVKDFAVWILYYSVYIPSVLIPVFQGYIDRSSQILLITSVFLSFLIILIPAGKNYEDFRSRYKLDRTFFWVIFFTAYFILNAFVFFMFGSRLSIVGVADVYVQRLAADDVLSNSYVGYASGFLAGAFNPFLITQGLWRKKPTLLILGIAGQIFIYATAAMKSVLLTVVFIPILYLAIRKREANLCIVGAIFAGVAILFMIIINNVDIEFGDILNEIVALIYMRTFCMAGVITGVYADFFTHHPMTFYSHINLVNRIVPYHYDAPLGVIIGEYLVPGSGLDANANFIATDGIAALGFAGVILAGLFFRVFIRVVDVATSPAMLPAVSASIVPALINVSNSSLFTTIITGGAGILVFLTYCWAVSDENDVQRHYLFGRVQRHREEAGRAADQSA